MSKHNYSQYAKKNNDAVQTAVEPEVTVTPAVVEDVETHAVDVTVTPAVVEPTPEVDKPVAVTGTVVNCAKLNVRAKADATADVLCVLDAASEIEVDVEKSTKDWVSVHTATGIEGYCMRKFINVNL